MKKTFFGFVVDQWSTVPPVEHADLSGKTVVVVGANTGIGFEAAKHFAQMRPARLVVACHSESKGRAAVSEIASTTGYDSCALWTIDLADFTSVKRFAERCERECDRVDVLVMNAGIAVVNYDKTIDGWEASLQVNHLGTALLSLLLLPLLVDGGKKSGTASRLVVVSSDVHYWAVIPAEVEESLNPITMLSSSKYSDPSSMGRRYSETKLLNVFFVRALQDRLQSIVPVTVNAVNPGFCASSLGRHLRGSLWGVINAMMQVFLARTSEQGSRQLVYGAVGGREDEERMKGAYVSQGTVEEPSDFVMSEEGKRMQDRVWRESVEILTREAPQLKTIIEECLV